MAVGGKVNFEVDDGTSIRQRENCGMCNKREHDGYCSPCKMNVCHTCFDLHLNIELCRNHVLLPDSQERNIQDRTIRFEICDEHKGQEIKAYCTEHKCCVCIECIVLHHKSCEWEYIVEASNRFQDSGDLARLLEEVQCLEYTLGKNMEAIDKHTKTAETIDKDVVSDIETFAKSLVKYVAGSKQQALDDAQVRESAHQQILDKLKMDIQSLVSQVEEMLTDFRNEDMVHKRFILAVATTPKVAQIQNEIAAIDCNNVITDYKFRQGNFLKRMMSNTRPIGRLTDASHIGDDEEDDEDIKLKKERERSQGLEQQLEENQKMMSKLKKDVQDMEQTYGRVVKDKQSLTEEVCALRDTNQKVVKDKKCLEQEICTLKSENQNVVSKLNKDLGDVKQNYDRVVKDKQSLEQHICDQKSSNQNVVSNLNKDIGDLKKNYDNVVSNLNKDIGDLKKNYDRVVKDKQSLPIQICALKVTNQKVVKDKKCLEQEICTLKSENQRVVKDKQSLEQQIGVQKSSNQETVSKLKQELYDMKQKHDQTVNLSCGHENLVGQFDENKLMACCTCGIIYGDQPSGTFTTNNEDRNTRLTFTFPKGTQSKLNSNPGLPYSGKTVTCCLHNDEEGKVILKMINIAFQRKCLFTVDNHGNIKNKVELYTREFVARRELEGLYFESGPYAEYIVRLRKQLEERGIKESDVTQL